MCGVVDAVGVGDNVLETARKVVAAPIVDIAPRSDVVLEIGVAIETGTEASHCIEIGRRL